MFLSELPLVTLWFGVMAVIRNVLSVSPGIVAKWMLTSVISDDLGMFESNRRPHGVSNDSE